MTFFQVTVIIFNMRQQSVLDFNKIVGNYVDFRLDGRWDGEGTIVEIFQENEGGLMVDVRYSVKLLRPCKEHATGTEILVDVEELI